MLDKIGQEIETHQVNDPGHVIFKRNVLEVPDICSALYRAAQTGVKVDLIMRDSCRLRPGLDGMSESFQVISIVGRFLEHARIYYFRNGGDKENFINSAAAMRRNLEHRVEVLAPVESPFLRQELQAMLAPCNGVIGAAPGR